MGQYKDDKKIGLKEIIAGASGITLTVIFFFMLGTVGAVELDNLSIKDALIRTVICFVLMGLSVIGLNYAEKEDDPYANL